MKSFNVIISHGKRNGLVLTISSAFRATILPTKLNQPLFTRQSHYNVEGLIGKCGRMCSMIRVYGSNLEVIFLDLQL
jgi:hypothetical protein